MKWIIIGSILLAILAFSVLPFTGGDNAKYYLLSRSLRQGNYRELWNPDMPIHTHFPITLPALLIPAPNYTSSKIIIFIFFILSLFAYMYYVKDYKKSIGFMALVLFAFSPILREYSHYVLSEIPYIFFSLMALILAQKKRYILASIFAIITFYTRIIGLTLLLTIAILVIIDWNKPKFVLLAFPVFASVYFIMGLILKGGGSNYLSYINPMLFFINFRAFTTNILGKLFGIPQISIILFGIMLLGIWKYRNRLIEIYAGLYMLVLMMWKWGWDYRLYLPLLPIFAIWIAYGIYNVSQRITKDNIILGWTAGLFILGNLSYTVATAPKTWENNRLWIQYREPPTDLKYMLIRHYLEAKKMIEEENISEEQMFMAQKSAMFYLFTGRKAIGVKDVNAK